MPWGIIVALWLSPTLAAVPIALANRPRWDRGTITATAPRWVPKQATAITVGLVILHRGELTAELRRHERVHALQWLLLGAPLFLATYLGHYGWLRLRGRNHWDAYRGIWLERWARRWAR